MLDSYDALELRVEKLEAELDRARKALEPFVAKLDAIEAQYRKRGGNPDKFHDDHPAFAVRANEIPMGIWRRAKAALARELK